MPSLTDDDTGALERARKRLYQPNFAPEQPRVGLSDASDTELPHSWGSADLSQPVHRSKRHVRLAGIFFGIAVIFFMFSLGIAGYFFYFGGNVVSIDKISLDIQGPTTIAGGDTVPLSLVITNRNPVAISDATLEIDFPDGTRDATDVLNPYPRYVENLGTLASGASVTRSVKAVIFGGEGKAVTLPVQLSYGTSGSNAVFQKKASYPLTISSTPLSVSIDTLTETVSGKPLTLTLTVRSNATVPLSNVVLSSALPFGFTTTNSSVPLNNGSFLLGTLAPGTTKTITLTGVLAGQDNEHRVFHFTIGTAKTSGDQNLAVTYMTQSAEVAITAPFINTALAINGDTSTNAVVAPGNSQSVTVSYANTLTTGVTNASVSIGIAGSAVDYSSITTTSGFYRSSDHTVVFSKDTDPSLASLAPGASGIGTFSFSTLPPGSAGSSPTIDFTISVSGTRVGQTNVPEDVTASVKKTIKVSNSIVLAASALHTSGPFVNSGPIPPRANQVTSYVIVLKAQDKGSAVASASVSTVLPSYVDYTGATNGAGTFAYDEASRTVSWNIGDIAQGATVQGAFQVAITPSTSQKGNAPSLTGPISFTGYDRFAGVQLSSTVDSVTTETPGDPGYTSTKGSVQ